MTNNTAAQPPVGAVAAVRVDIVWQMISARVPTQLCCSLSRIDMVLHAQNCDGLALTSCAGSLKDKQHAEVVQKLHIRVNTHFFSGFRGSPGDRKTSSSSSVD